MNRAAETAAQIRLFFAKNEFRKIRVDQRNIVRAEPSFEHRDTRECRDWQALFVAIFEMQGREATVGGFDEAEVADVGQIKAALVSFAVNHKPGWRDPRARAMIENDLTPDEPQHDQPNRQNTDHPKAQACGKEREGEDAQNQRHP